MKKPNKHLNQKLLNTVDKDFANKNINTDASDPSQTEKSWCKWAFTKNPQSEIIQAKSLQIHVGAEENKYMDNGDSTATSFNKENDSKDLVWKETSVNKKNDSK